MKVWSRLEVGRGIGLVEGKNRWAEGIVGDKIYV